MAPMAPMVAIQIESVEADINFILKMLKKVELLVVVVTIITWFVSSDRRY
jgi:hypothetical protein